MLITALGHAGLQVTEAEITVLVDPWLSPEGAFLGSWFPFPDNAHVLNLVDREPAAVLVTHEHLDHVDPWFLRQLPPTTPIVIPAYPSPVLRNKLAEAGGIHPIIELAAWERHRIGDRVEVFFVPEASPMNHDSGLVLVADGHVLVNLNDARLFPVQLRRIRTEVGGRIHALTAQGAGASWFPVCYDYDAERMAALRDAKRSAKLAYLASSIEILEPDVALPFAGPPCFLDAELTAINAEMDGGIFPTQHDVASWLLSERGIESTLLLPGERWDTTTSAHHQDARWNDFWSSDRASYLSDYAARRELALAEFHRRYPPPTEPLDSEIRAYFKRLLRLSPYFNEQIDMRVGFDIVGPGGGQWTVDFRPGYESVDSGLDDCQYRYSFASRWMAPIVAGDLPWEDFFLSLRFRARRDPDLYNDHLLGLLKFADRAALDAVELAEQALDLDTMITIECDGDEYRIGRYCPHAGNDLLETGETLPGGVIRCLAHHYDFDLATGVCINGRSKPLRIDAGEPLPAAPEVL